MHTDFSSHLNAALEHFQRDLQSLRTGRATPGLIEELPVECYGSRSPLQQIASISAPEPRLLVVQPWDPSVVKEIEKAILTSNLGITPVVDGKTIRLPFPPMTEERRTAMVKQLQELAEQTRVRIRSARENELKTHKADQREGKVSEDALADTTKRIQAEVDAAVGRVAELVASKTEEIMTI